MAKAGSSELEAASMFAQLKRESLRKLRAFEDKSPKGSIDEPIVDLIRAINDHPNYVRGADKCPIRSVGLTSNLVLRDR